MLLFALLAPFGAIILSLLLVVAVSYAAVYSGLYHLFNSCFWPDRRPKAGSGALENVVKRVNMLGLHIEAEPGAVTIRDQQHEHQQAVLQLFRAHGHRNSNIYTTFSNPEMQVLLLPGIGCMVYTTAAHWGLSATAAVGDPVCAPEHTPLMLQAYLQAFPQGAFMDASKLTAQLVQQQLEGGASMTVTDMGTETVIDVQKFHFEFNKKVKHIRRRADMAARAGLIVEEVTPHSSSTLKEQVQQMALEWQQGKEVTEDLKVFSRTIPFQYLGRETDVRVFIARTLNPGEAPPLTVAMATKVVLKKQAAAAKAAAEDDTTPSSAPLSRKQRKLRERAQRAKALKQQQQYDIAATAASPDDAAADTDAAAAVLITSDTKQHSDQQQQQQQQVFEPARSVASSTSTAAAADFATIELVSLDPLGDKLTPSATYSSSSSSKSGLSSFPSGISSSGSNDGGGCGSNGSGHIHACVVLDPVYRDGEVVGYVAERTFLSPNGVKGGVKLIMKEVLGLLKAEGKSFLNLGVAVAQDIKPGSYHGFSDCTWLSRTLRLCWEYGNDLYAFKNLAEAKLSWGGGYDPSTDSHKFREAVHLNRRFVLLPAGWSSQLSHGPLMLGVMFRHIGVLGDPWELFAFWRYF